MSSEETHTLSVERKISLKEQIDNVREIAKSQPLLVRDIVRHWLTLEDE